MQVKSKEQVTLQGIRMNSFVNEKGETVEWAKATFLDEDGQILRANINKTTIDDTEIKNIESAGLPLLGHAEFIVQEYEQGGKTTTKIRLNRFEY